MSDTLRVAHVAAQGDVRIVVIENSVDELHKLVGGYFEVFRVRDLTTDPMRSVIGLCDEDGWRVTPEHTPTANIWSPFLYDGVIAGDIVLVRAEPHGDFISLRDSDITTLRRIFPAHALIVEV